MIDDPCMISLSGITKRFLRRKGILKQEEITAIDGVDLRVNRGRIFGLLGPNGAGKTTLAKILVSLISPDEGEGTVNGYDLRDERGIRSSVGLILPNERSFYWRMTGRENLKFFGTLHNIPSRRLRERIGEVLDILHLSGIADAWVQGYSSGMRQRLSIARGLLHDPELLIMDEPTRGLDPLVRRELLDFIKDVLVKRLAKTIFIATNDIAEVERVCDTTAVIDKGKIRICDSTEKLISQEGSLYNLFVRMTLKK